MEQALKDDIIKRLPDFPPDRFIPYIQLHEFEALFFTDIRVLTSEYQEWQPQIDQLYRETVQLAPEEINDGPKTAPSKRIQGAVPIYKKGEAAADLLENINVPELRKKCPHFSHWLKQLESI